MVSKRSEGLTFETCSSRSRKGAASPWHLGIFHHVLRGYCLRPCHWASAPRFRNQPPLCSVVSTDLGVSIHHYKVSQEKSASIARSGSGPQRETCSLSWGRGSREEEGVDPGGLGEREEAEAGCFPEYLQSKLQVFALFVCFFISCYYWSPPLPSSPVCGSYPVFLVPNQSTWNKLGVRFAIVQIRLHVRLYCLYIQSKWAYSRC